MNGFYNSDICTKCKGSCCKVFPCSCFPEDFGVPLDEQKLRAAFSSGKYCIDWWEGDPRDGHYEFGRGYFVRPVVKGEEGRLTHPAWSGTCTFLGDAGCLLSPDERPKEGRMLEPIPGGSCVNHTDGKKGCAIAWIPYYKLLENIIAEDK